MLRKRADGSRSFLAQISITRGGRRVHSEAQTFDRRPAAAAWITRREAELKENPELLGRDAKARDPLLRDVIDLYVADSRKEIGKTKAQVLEAIKRYDIADLRCSKIGSVEVLDFARDLSNGRQPQTVANYLSHLGAVFAIARIAWGAPLDEGAMKDALKGAKRLGITGKSKSRSRRPTLDELDRLLSHFLVSETRHRGVIPMTRIVPFAIFSARRQDEITRLRWADFDEAQKRVLVRDMKHPGEKMGNDTWVDLPDEAVAIIKATVRGKAEEIFPYDAGSISASFTRAAILLGINEESMADHDRLHFHDLRHEGVSRLFEIGYSIPRAALVSGHRTWASLKRYTHLGQVGDKFAGWKWQERATAPRGLRLVGGSSA